MPTLYTGEPRTHLVCASVAAAECLCGPSRKATSSRQACLPSSVLDSDRISWRQDFLGPLRSERQQRGEAFGERGQHQKAWLRWIEGSHVFRNSANHCHIILHETEWLVV
jgi:hypothetical protein